VKPVWPPQRRAWPESLVAAFLARDPSGKGPAELVPFRRRARHGDASRAQNLSSSLCARGGDLALSGAAGRGGSAFPAAALSTGAKARSDTGILPERPFDECGQLKRDGNDRLRATAMPADAAEGRRVQNQA